MKENILESIKNGEVIGSALPASPGAAAGKVVFTAEKAKADIMT